MPAIRQITGFRGPNPAVGKLTQFRPGESGNPSGRPKGLLSRWLRYELEENDPETKEQIAQKIAKLLVKRALQGDLKAIQLVFERVEGKLPSSEWEDCERSTVRVVVEHIGQKALLEQPVRDFESLKRAKRLIG